MIQCVNGAVVGCLRLNSDAVCYQTLPDLLLLLLLLLVATFYSSQRMRVFIRKCCRLNDFFDFACFCFAKKMEH